MNSLFWFFQDLRLNDNPALIHACQQAQKTDSGAARVIPLYILDDCSHWPIQGAQRWWLHESLKRLSASIQERGGKLLLKKGNPLAIIQQLLKTYPIEAMYFTRAYDPYQLALQAEIKALCASSGVACKQYPGTLLLEPEQTLNKEGKPFQVFTPYSKQFHQLSNKVKPKVFSSDIRFFKHKVDSDQISDWSLLPTQPDWSAGFSNYWQPGEAGALDLLKSTLQDIVESYERNRDFPAKAGTSKLSSHLHFGEISPSQIWHTIEKSIPPEIAWPYLRQLVWREFNYSLLFHWPHILEKSFKPKFDSFPWVKNKQHLKSWQRGNTGYPIVDAGMRQLYATGWMHNRVRMITASFLTKHLRIHWLEGARWFWDTLLDADLANNIGGWQWVAGSGADAAPYFRIFNPVLQGEKFDPNGEYIRRWVPELRDMPNAYIHQPWKAPAKELDSLSKRYPKPIVDHAKARAEALAAYKSLTP